MVAVKPRLSYASWLVVSTLPNKCHKMRFYYNKYIFFNIYFTFTIKKLSFKQLQKISHLINFIKSDFFLDWKSMRYPPF